ncbi:hypothetical protein C161_14383 [Paenibacillus sp. FSL R5-192]|uniref:hypothetical protein n=1 Tax=unclassified Paenibacillus TaxID=185978 RepID=UPI0003E29CE1|nr:hypothetical protein [Paenibacillus sp. FSL R5-192]ETT37706.1 hypothetical protein C161_14383 [Paenibacillus sp. FSL R5-192]
MNQRFRITRSMQESNAEQSISLEECKLYFESQPDFTYSAVLNIVGAESTMTIEGDFFMWDLEGAQIAFRLYMGDLYVAISNEAIVPKMIEIATDLRADIVEG